MALRERVNALRNFVGHLRFRVRTRFVAVMVPALALSALMVLALAERVRTLWRRLRGKRPRLLWGPSAILNNKYWSRAIATRGYESLTFADYPATITARADFDVDREELIRRSRLPERWHDYVPFAWALRRGDVFLMHFDGGFLRHTPLEWRELGLLRLVGKKLIVSPFGGDIAVPGYLGRLEAPLLADYPDLPKQAELTKRRVLHSLRYADVSILTTQPGFQPRSSSGATSSESTPSRGTTRPRFQTQTGGTAR